jgi:hypothetical protein
MRKPDLTVQHLVEVLRQCGVTEGLLEKMVDELHKKADADVNYCGVAVAFEMCVRETRT